MSRSVKLEVFPNSPSRPWYADGLNFTCTQCGNCCTGGPGFVWISREEVGRLAEFMGIGAEQVIDRYCRVVNGHISLKESRNARGEYDCVFLKEERVERPGDQERVVQTRRSCTVYPVRPLQCRTWPFWEGNLSSPEVWNRSAQRCHGMNRGRRFTPKQVEDLRDAKDWPKRPPTSDG